MVPFQMKSKRSMVRMGKLSSKQAELQKQYAKNQQKYQEELTKLYQEEGVASQKPPESQPAAPERAVLLHGLQGILGAGGDEAAPIRLQPEKLQWRAFLL